MVMLLLLLLIFAGCAVAIYRWRWGVVAAILVALIQDPLRKMIPGTPGYLVMATLPVWCSVLASALGSGDVRIHRFLSQFPLFARYLGGLGLYLFIPAAISASYGHNSWMITLLGAFMYTAGFCMLVAGWCFPRKTDDIFRILLLYVCCTSMALLGGPLDYFGWTRGIAAVGTAALDTIWVTHRTGEAVYMYSGFFRSPDVMGWHAALTVMIAGLLAVRSRGWVRWVLIALAVWASLNLWICGRRKMLSMLPVFWGIYLLLICRYMSLKKGVSIAGVLLLLTGAGWVAITRTYQSTAFNTFYLTAMEEAEEAVMQHGFRAVVGTVQQAGFWGYGLGMGQQGVHHIPAETPRLWQESGPSKIVAEIGVPGLILLLAAAAVLLRTALQVIRCCNDPARVHCTVGLLSILLANAASGVVSGQIFGDPFVLILLAFLMGLLLSGKASA